MFFLYFQRWYREVADRFLTTFLGQLNSSIHFSIPSQVFLPDVEGHLVQNLLSKQHVVPILMVVTL